MPPDPPQTPEEEFDARLDRLEKELEARLDKQAADDPLLTTPPKPQPIPEVLREPARRHAPVLREGYSDDFRARLVRASAIGTNFVVAVVAMGFLGWLVDRWRGTKPAFLLTGLLLGLVYGFYRFIREARAIARQAAEESRRR
jgi:F0F1-type ATP synthase assembly protein I